MIGFIIGLAIGFIGGGGFILKIKMEEIVKGQAIYIGGDEYRCKCVEEGK